jgi:thiosulfate/3-mercaptopyruvate sulfurtransferase
VLIDADWIAAHLDDPDVRVVEVDVSGASYDQGHIPGAILWNAYTDLRHPGYTAINRDELDGLISRTGVTADITVAFYGYAPLLGYWLLDGHGHERIRVMNGPRERWEGAGHPWSTDVPEPRLTTYERQGDKAGLVVSRDQMRKLIGAPDAVILDVRSPEEFTRERFWPSEPRRTSGALAISRERSTCRSMSSARMTGPRPIPRSCAAVRGAGRGVRAQSGHLLHDRESSEPGRLCA